MNAARAKFARAAFVVENVIANRGCRSDLSRSRLGAPWPGHRVPGIRHCSPPARRIVGSSIHQGVGPHERNWTAISTRVAIFNQRVAGADGDRPFVAVSHHAGTGALYLADVLAPREVDLNAA